MLLSPSGLFGADLHRLHRQSELLHGKLGGEPPDLHRAHSRRLPGETLLSRTAVPPNVGGSPGVNWLARVGSGAWLCQGGGTSPHHLN